MGTFIKILQILVHKAGVNKLKKIQIIQTMFSDHSCIKVEINDC